ncbi:MAG: carboxypeptidase-like regulatory domain-containing protein [Pyrinomonadaceae bacterium]
MKFWMVIFVFVLVFCSEIFSQVETGKLPVPDAITVAGTSQTTLTNTLNFTVPAGNNRVLLVIASDADSTDISSVSFGGTPMTQQAERQDGFAVDSIWTLPLGTGASGTNANIVVVSTGTTPAVSTFIGAIAFTDVDQTTPVDGVQMANMITTENVGSTLNVTSEPGDLVFDIFDSFDDNPAVESQTPGAGQTQIHNADGVAAPGGDDYYQTSSKPGAASVTMSWTSTNDAMIHIAFNINGVAPTAASTRVGGRVLSADGRGLPNSLLTLADSEGNTRLTRTNQFGYFHFDEVQLGGVYVLSAFSKGHTFSNPTLVIPVNEELTNLNFFALP